MSPGPIATNQIAASYRIRSSKDVKLQAYSAYMAYRAYMLQTRRLTVLQGYKATCYKNTLRSLMPLKGPVDIYI